MFGFFSRFFSNWFFSEMTKYFSIGFFKKSISWSRRIVLKRFPIDSGIPDAYIIYIIRIYICPEITVTATPGLEITVFIYFFVYEPGYFETWLYEEKMDLVYIYAYMDGLYCRKRSETASIRFSRIWSWTLKKIS